MTETTSRQFGLIVAYLLPGFIALAGVAPLAPMVADWLRPANLGQLDIAAPVYAIMAATAMGMIVSCFRWLIIDRIHARTGLAAPAFDFSRLENRLAAFDYLVDAHYRYYQFYANTMLAVIWTYAIHRWMNVSALLGWGTDLGAIILCATLFAGSRDALAKYYTRTSQLVGNIAEKGDGYHDERNRPSRQGRSFDQEAGPTQAPK